MCGMPSLPAFFCAKIDMARMISQWRYPAASSEALDLLHSAMCAASHQHIVMAIEVASKGGLLLSHQFLLCITKELKHHERIKFKTKIVPYCLLTGIPLFGFRQEQKTPAP